MCKAMSLFIPVEIARGIVEYSYQNWVATYQPVDISVYNWYYFNDITPKDKPLPNDKLDRSLLQLRATNRTFRAAVDEVLFQTLEINEISYKSLARIEGLLNSPSIRLSIRKYKFTAHVSQFRPIVLRDESAYRDMYLRNYAAEPKQSVLLEIHERRLAGAKRYDEQAEIMLAKPRSPGWILRNLRQLVGQPKTDRSHSRLRELPYLGRVGDLPNLTSLHIGYCDFRWHEEWQDAAMHNFIKNDISTGLGSVLADSLPRLERLVIELATLSDIRDIVRSAAGPGKQQRTVRLSSVKSLEVTINGDSIMDMTVRLVTFTPIVGHASGGRDLTAFLALFPELEDLSLTHEDGGDIMLVQHFDPPLLPELRTVKLGCWIMNSSALRRLTLGDEDTAKMKIRTAYIDKVRLITGSDSWAEVLAAWADECQKPWQKEPLRYPQFFVKHPRDAYCPTYLDSTYSDEKSWVAGQMFPFQAALYGTIGDREIYDQRFGYENEDGWRFCHKQRE